LEPFDDDHAAAAAGAGMIWRLRLGRIGAARFDSINGNDWRPEQFAVNALRAREGVAQPEPSNFVEPRVSHGQAMAKFWLNYL
jgi:hypothetical protein